jgi:hypothetical protein
MDKEVMIGGIVIGAVVIVGVFFLGKKREQTEDTGFGVERNSFGGTRRRRGSRRTRRVKI